MAEIIVNIAFLVTLIVIFIIADRKSKKRTDAIKKLTQREIETNLKVCEALDMNTKAITESDLEFEYEPSKKELINKLKDAWISDQASLPKSIPFVEWLIEEVSNG